MSTIIDRPEAAPKDSDLSELGYSIYPSRLAFDLGDGLSRDTSRIDFTLTTLMQESLSLLLHNRFNGLPPHIDIAVMKKLSNSLLSAGSSGKDRTKKALMELLFANRNSGGQSLDLLALSSELWTTTKDYRKTSSYLDHQAKCVNAFLKIFQENFEVLKTTGGPLLQLVRNTHDFEKWAKHLVKYWIDETSVNPKNQAMYINAWQLFAVTIVSPGKDSYADVLLKNVRSYLHPADFENFERIYSRVQDTVPVVTPILLAPKTTLKLEGGFTSLSTTFKLAPEKVAEIKDVLFFLFSKDPQLKMQKLELFIPADEPDTLVVRFTPPSEMIVYRRMIDALNKNIQEAYSHVRQKPITLYS